ncbi:hypothetical protein LVD15_17360 [Fulvivirga maritima]|uniref:hypothetical protein n=1 Tax=Fulvivirga maritima TaxID=2904247 RepID=UPI001F3F3163|nr:hypothetical protein [Fulvivirga maritima]UII25069.1 hypothetical protein LVD15_17360 [Fulvivirga maritima]
MLFSGSLLAKPSLDLPDDTTELKCLLQTSLDDETKLQVYYKLARKYYDENTDLAHYYLDQVEVLSKNVDDKLSFGKAIYFRGYIYLKLHDSVNAMSFFLEVGFYI